MKMVRPMMALLLAYAAVVTSANADPFSEAAAAEDNSNDNPKVEQDAFGAPLSLTRSPLYQHQPTSAEIEASKKYQAQAEKDKDWLLRGYEQQLQVNSPELSSNKDKNLYYELRSNKDLAKLAGLTPLDDNPTASLRTGVSDSDKSALALRADPSVTNNDPFNISQSGAVFKPLITPLGSPDAAGLHNFYALEPFGAAPTPPSNNDLARTAPPADLAKENDTMAIETPGMVAAESDPAVDGTDLTLDLLPGESKSEAQDRPDNISPLELPLKTDLIRLHNQQDAVLKVPGAPTSTPANPAIAKPLAQKYPNDFEPVKIASPSPIRQPIADPYDIFYR